MHTESLSTFQNLKLVSRIVKENRNVFCSLGYFKPWSLRWSLCRQTSQQASLDGLRYSLADEMVLFRAALCKSGCNECLLFGFKPSHKLKIKFVFHYHVMTFHLGIITKSRL